MSQTKHLVPGTSPVNHPDYGDDQSTRLEDRLMRMLLVASLWAAGMTVVLAGLNPAFAGDGTASPVAAKECIADKDSDFGKDGGKFIFTMNFDNNCARPITCTIDAYITGYRGPTSAHTTLHFPAMKTSPARKTYVVKVKAAFGTAQYGRSCSFV